MTKPSSRPVPPIEAGELARRNNEAEAEHRWLENKRRARRVAQALSGTKLSRKQARQLDALDRVEAARATRPTRAVGFFLPGPS